jgi:hypothetical protein
MDKKRLRENTDRKQTDKQTDRRTERQTGRQTEKLTERQKEKQKKETERQTNNPLFTFFVTQKGFILNRFRVLPLQRCSFSKRVRLVN